MHALFVLGAYSLPTRRLIGARQRCLLAFAYNDAIDVVSNIDLTDCTGTINQVIASGTDPSWGPANVNPAQRTNGNQGSQDSQGSQGNQGVNGAQTSTGCDALHDAALQRCQANQIYQAQLTACAKKYKAGSSKLVKCRREATTTHNHAVAVIKCEQIKNKHKRARCVAQAKK